MFNCLILILIFYVKNVTRLPFLIPFFLHVPPGISITKLPVPAYVGHCSVVQGGQL